LITGGLGAIGFRLADYSVSQGAQRVFLVGRTAQPTAEQQRQLDQWRNRGISVQLISADVNSQEGLVKLSGALNGKPIDSVFHAAGIDFLSPIADWNSDDIRRVTEAKIRGAWNMHRWSLSHPVKRFVLTSSIASIWGAPSRFLYASGNAFLDALGQWRASQKLPVTVLNFGPWSDGGMADVASLNEYRRVGMESLAPNRTVSVVGRLIHLGVPHAVVTDTRWDLFVSVMSARRPRPFFDKVVDEGGVANSYLIANDSDKSPSNRVEERYPWISSLRSMEQEKRESELQRMICKELAEVLKLQQERISPDRNLYRLGLDSITAVELSMRLRKGTGIAAVRLLSREPTVESIAAGLMEDLNDKIDCLNEIPEERLGVGQATAPWANELSVIKEVEAKRVHLLNLLRRELTKYIGRSASQITEQTAMLSIGLDSLGAVDFATQLRKQLGLSYPPRLMQYANLGEWISTVITPGLEKVDSATDALNVEPKSSEPGEIILYDLTKHSEVMEFCSKGWPNRNANLQRRRWDWMFIDSAKRVGVPPRIWLARDERSIVGHMGAQFIRLKVSHEEITCAWFVDTMVLDFYRTQGVGAQILLQAEEDVPIAMSLGQTPEVRRILDSLGWKQICPLNIHVFMNRPDRVLRGKFPMGIKTLARAYFGLNRSRRKALKASRDRDIEIRRIDRFNENHDSIWRAMSEGVSCTVARDCDYLNWKYIEQPGHHYDCWEVRCTGDLVGILVTRIEEPNDSYAYRRLHWVDLVCQMDSTSLDAIIHGCIAVSEKLGVDAISAQLTNQSIEKRLKLLGFVSRPATRYLYISRGIVEAFPQVDCSDWLVSHGDSDIDRPE